MTNKTLSEIRAQAGKKGGQKGGQAKVPKGFSKNKELARENAHKTNAKKRAQ